MLVSFSILFFITLILFLILCSPSKKTQLNVADYHWLSEFNQAIKQQLKYQQKREFEALLLQEAYMKMDHYDFEDFVANVLNQFDYHVSATQKMADGGKDLIGTTPQGHLLYGEVKHYWEGNHVDRETMQKLIGAGVAQGISNYIFVTTSAFKQTALDYVSECEQSNLTIRLIDGIEFKEMVHIIQTNGVDISTLYPAPSI